MNNGKKIIRHKVQAFREEHNKIPKKYFKEFIKA
jgi:hypothetical protein